MKLYICYSSLKWMTWQTPRPGGHPCGNALEALEGAGHEPELVSVHGLGMPLLDRTDGREEVKRLTGQTQVPVLVTDDGEAIRDSKAIIAWAHAHPA